MSLFEGRVERILGAAFASIYPDGTLRRIDKSYTDGGDVIETVTEHAIKVQTDRLSERQVGAPNFSDRDVALIILTYGLPVTPVTDDEVETAGRRYRIAGPIERDGAGSHYKVRGVVLNGDD